MRLAVNYTRSILYMQLPEFNHPCIHTVSSSSMSTKEEEDMASVRTITIHHSVSFDIFASHI